MLPASSADHAVLDRPIWAALTTEQSHLAIGGALALRYPSDMAPFAATREETPDAFEALRELVPTGGRVALFTPHPIPTPPGLELQRAAEICQMIAVGTPPARIDDTGIVSLSDADVPDMQKLVDLTKPGPFASRTHKLGRYIGIRINGRLVAMLGERMQMTGYAEMSAVCVHPDHRGKGYAQALTAILMRGMAGRGVVPFLHVFADNAPAIALYRRMGFDIRQRLHLASLYGG